MKSKSVSKKVKNKKVDFFPIQENKKQENEVREL